MKTTMHLSPRLMSLTRARELIEEINGLNMDGTLRDADADDIITLIEAHIDCNIRRTHEIGRAIWLGDEIEIEDCPRCRGGE